MALIGNELLEVTGITNSGLPSGQTFITTTGQLASSGRSLGTLTVAGAGVVTVTNSAVTTTSQISFTLKTVGGTVGVGDPTIKTITAGTGFTITATTANISVYNYQIQNSF